MTWNQNKKFVYNFKPFALSQRLNEIFSPFFVQEIFYLTKHKFVNNGYWLFHFKSQIPITFRRAYISISYLDCLWSVQIKSLLLYCFGPVTWDELDITWNCKSNKMHSNTHKFISWLSQKPCSRCCQVHSAHQLHHWKTQLSYSFRPSIQLL